MPFVPKPLILLVEDDEDDAFLSRRFLEKCGCKVSWTKTAEDGLIQLAQWHQYGAIITDLKMPGMGGHGLLQELGVMRSPLVIMVLTSSSDRRDVERAYAAGATIYCEKPIDLHEWEELVCSFVTLFFNSWTRRRPIY